MKFKQIVSLFMVGILVGFVPWVSGCGGGSNATGSSAGTGGTGGGSTLTTFSMSGSVVVESKDLQALGVSTLKTSSLPTSSQMHLMGMDDISLQAYRQPRLLPLATNLEYTAVCKVLGSSGDYEVLNDSNGKPVTLTISQEADTSMKWELNTNDSTVIEKAKAVGIIPSITCENPVTGAVASFEALVAPNDVTESIAKKESMTVPITTASKMAMDQIQSQLKESLSPLIAMVGSSAENRKLIEAAIAKIIEVAAPILIAAIEKMAAADSASLPTLVATKGQENVQYSAFQQQLQKNKSVMETSKSMDSMMVRDMAAGTASNTQMQKYMADRQTKDFAEMLNKDMGDMTGANEHFQTMMSNAAKGDGTVGKLTDFVSAVNAALSSTEQLDAKTFASEMTAFIKTQQDLRVSGEKLKKLDTYMADGTLFVPVMEVYPNASEQPVWDITRNLSFGELKLAFDYLVNEESMTGIDVGYVMASMGGAFEAGAASGGAGNTISIRYDSDLPIRVMLLPGSEDLILNSRIKIESFDSSIWDKAKVTLTYTRKSGGKTTVEFDPPTTAEKNLFERAWYLGDRTVDGKIRGPQVTDFSPNSKATITVTYTSGGKETSQTIDTTLRYIDLSKIQMSLIKPSRVATSDKASSNKELVSAYSPIDVVFEAKGAVDGLDYEVKYAVEITEVGAKEGSGFIYSSFPYSIWHDSGGASLYPNGQGTDGFKAGTYQLLIQPVAVSRQANGSWDQKLMATGTPVVTYFKLVDSSSDISGTEGVLKGTIKASSDQLPGTTLRVGLFDHSSYNNNAIYQPVVSAAVETDGSYALTIKAEDLIKAAGTTSDSSSYYSTNRSYYLMVWEDYDSQGTRSSADLGSVSNEMYLASNNPSWFGNKTMSIYMDVNRKSVSYNVEEYASGGYYLAAKPTFYKPLSGTLSGVDFDMNDHPSRSSSSSSAGSGSSASDGFASTGGYGAGYSYGGFSYSDSVAAPGVGESSSGTNSTSNAAPTVAKIYPNTGFYQGMERIHIQGGGLCPDGRVVKIGTWEMHSVVEGSSYDGTELKASVPLDIPAGTYDVVVTTLYGTSKVSSTTKFTVIDKSSITTGPALTSIRPARARAGDWIEIEGSNLVDIKSIKVGSQAEALYYNSTGPTSLQLMIPGDMKDGTYSISVATEYGQSTAGSAASLTVYSSATSASTAAAIPFVTSLSPSTWPNTSAVSVTVQGTGLDEVTGADLIDSSGTLVSKLQYNPGTFYVLPVKVPSGLTAGTYYLRVTNSAGNSPNTSYNEFTVEAPVTYGAPEIESISPSSGSGSDNVTIRVRGKNLVNIPYLGVKLRGAKSGVMYYASHFTLTNPPTEIEVTTVTGLQPDDYYIVIENESGTKSSLTNTEAKFTVLSAADAAASTDKKYPSVSSLSPSSGKEGEDVSVTISGSNFTGAFGVYIGGYPLDNVKVISDSIITATLTHDLQVGSHSVEVLNSTGSNYSLAAAAGPTFTVSAGTPTITYVDPQSTTVGTPKYGVALLGTNFSYGMTAKLVNTSTNAEVLLTSVAYNGSTLAYVDIPATLAAGTYHIVVTTSGGSSPVSSTACQFLVAN